MGIFTWTDATVKNPKQNKWGDYKDKDVVMYGEYAKLICPDDTEIETNHHDYYGIIGGHDIYDLVAEWNKADLLKLKDWSDIFMPVIKMFMDGKDDEEISEKAKEIFGEDSYMVQDWKRNIGIEISVWDDTARKLRYPIKLTKNRNAHGYNNLYISYSTQ